MRLIFFLALAVCLAISEDQVAADLKGGNFTVRNEITLNKTQCHFYEVEVHLFNNNNDTHGRLVSCPKSILETHSILGIINKETIERFIEKFNVSLNVSLNCYGVNVSSHHDDQYELHSDLEVAITEVAMIRQPFHLRLYFLIICSNFGSNTRYDAGHYYIVYDTKMDQSPTAIGNTEGLVTNSPSSVENQSPTPIRTTEGLSNSPSSTFTEMDQSPAPIRNTEGLIPNSPSSTDGKKETDGVFGLYFFALAVIISFLIWLGILIVSVYNSGEVVFAM